MRLKIIIPALVCILFLNAILTMAQEDSDQPEQPRMAILPFADTNIQARNLGYGEAVSGMLATGIINGAVFRVVERTELERIMNEQAFQISGAVNAETAKRIGEIYAVDYLLFGSVAKFGSQIETDIRLVDTQTGEAILAESANAPSETAVRGMVQNLVQKIENRYRLNVQSENEPGTISQPAVVTGSGSTEGMVLIPAGTYTMGSDAQQAPYNERPPRTITMDAFYMDRTEVTNAQYQKFVEATGARKPSTWNSSRFNKPNQPVVGISWEDAARYAAWAGKRLPTEAEWEYAARGGLHNALYPWGNDGIKGRACAGKSYMNGQPEEVAQYEPNGYGLYDMAGNAAEWCADWFREDAYKDAQSHNPQGPPKTGLKVVRGGSWYEDAFYLRVSARKGIAPANYSNSVGFRCVASAR